MLKEDLNAGSRQPRVPFKRFSLSPDLPSVRGLVFEELAETYQAKAKVNANRAYKDLLQDQWFSKMEPQRLERMKKMKDE